MQFSQKKSLRGSVVTHRTRNARLYFSGRVRNVRATFSLALVACLILSFVGCKPQSTSSDRSARATQQRRISASSALIDFVTGQLNDLPSANTLELAPPSVVLDATSSRDGKDVMATIGNPPNVNTPLNNYLSVPNRNVDFQAAGIRPGDTLKCYLLPDAATRARLTETGEIDTNILAHEPIDLRVAQVVDRDALLIEGGLRIPVRIAKDLGSRLDKVVVDQLKQMGLPADFVLRQVEAMKDAGLTNTDGVPLPPEIVQVLPGTAWPFRIEIWRNRDDRMIDINDALGRYAARAEPPLGWEPTADASALALIVERLNQWIRSRSVPDDWAPDAVVDSLDKKVAEDNSLAKFISVDALRANQFADYEGRWIQEAIWLRDLSRWASGKQRDPLKRAAHLFDWTVRNVALTDDPRVEANRPWQALLYGRGTATQRAWVFAALCHQLRLPVVVLELPIEKSEPWLWCGLLEKGKLHLFDPQLGLAIPGNESEAETATIATLAQVQADDALLRALDLEDSPYPITAPIAKQAIANVVGDSFSLSWRASLLQKQFTGDGKLTLAARAQSIADDVAKLESVSSVQLWSKPFELLRRRLALGPKARQAIAVQFRPYAWRPRLWKARVLHLRGMLETAEQARRKANRRNDALYDAINDHRSAGQLYMHRTVRPPDDALASITGEKRGIYQRAKTDATYWLGMLQYEEASYRSARQWLEMMQGMEGAERYAEAANYNRARVLEALGQNDQAAELLRASSSPQRHGDRLRASRLTAKQ